MSLISLRVAAAGLIVITLASACAADPERSEAVTEESDDCGPDVIELFLAGDPEIVALYDADDPETAKMWLTRVHCLAEDGDAESQLKMGIAYRDGSDGPPQDYVVAAEWFRRAAAQGHPMAQFNLGRFYEDGRGVPLDLVRAHMWFNLAGSAFDWKDPSRRNAFQRRDQLETRLTPVQLREAQQLAREWWEAAAP